MKPQTADAIASGADFDFPDPQELLAVLVPTPVAPYCYLYEALLWIALQRYPIFSYWESGDVRLDIDDMEGIDPRIKTIDSSRPALVLGSELRRFIGDRRAKRRCPTPAGMIYCLRCRAARRPAGDVVDYLPRTAMTGDLQGICPKCEAMLYRRINLGRLEVVRGGLDVTRREADSRISEREEPSLNYDSRTPAFAHADAQS